MTRTIRLLPAAQAAGKHHGVSLGAIARKLCFIIFSVLSENRPFEQRLHNAIVEVLDPVQVGLV